MNEWRRGRLGEVVDLVAGFAFSSKKFTQNPDDVRLLRGANIGQGFLKWTDDKRWSTEDGSVKDRFKLRVDDVVLAMDRPWIDAGLKWAWIKESDLPMHLVQRVARLRGRDGLLTNYLRYVVGSPPFTNYIRPIVTGVNVPHISGEQISNYSFDVPPLDVQRKTVAILSPFDDLIANNTRRIEILEEMARAIYREWFVEFRYPGHESVPLVESELGPIPEGWDWATLADHSEVTMGQSPRSEYYNDVGDGLPFHQGVTNFGRHFPEHVKYCTVENRIAVPGDTLVSVRAPVGRINVADTRLVIGRGLAAVRSSDDLHGYHYRQLQHAFRDEDSMGGGTIFKAITKGDLLGVPWLDPSLEMKKGFGDIERPMFSMIANLSLQNRTLMHTRDLLLPRLVSGEIDVSHLDLDEVA